MKSNKGYSNEYQQECKFKQLPVNLEQTLKLQKSTLYVKYMKWLKDNGVMIDSRIRYPTYFGQTNKGTVGISANKAIQKNRAIIAVPYNLLITVDKAKENQELLIIIKENMDIFQLSPDSAAKIIILYVLYQLIQGQKSFYYPYFAINQSQFMSGWSNWTSYMIQNKGVISQLKSQQSQLQNQFLFFLRIFRRYDKIFPQNIGNTQYKALFDRAYSFVITRAFGWSLPSISLIPLADSLNHGNIRYLNHFVANLDRQKDVNISFQQKFHKNINFAIFKDQTFSLNNEELAHLRKQTKSKSYKFIEKHKQLLSTSQKLKQKQNIKQTSPIDKQSSSLTNLKSKNQIRKKQYHILNQQYKAGIHKLKHLHFYQSSCSQDNDTDQEELSSRTFKRQTASLNDKQRNIVQSNKKKEIQIFWKTFLQDQENNQQNQQQQQQQIQAQINPNNKKPQKSLQNQTLKKDLLLQLSKQNYSSQIQSDQPQQQDQQFTWLYKTNNLKTYFIMNTKQIIRQNEQIYNFYGRRSNKFLLLGYNFILQDNIYDSFNLKILLNQQIISKVTPPFKLIYSYNNNKKDKNNNQYSQNIRLKRYRINIDLINICRSYIILWNKKQNYQSCKITIPFDRDVENKTLELYQDIVGFLLKEYSTDVDEDEELLQNQALKYQERVAIVMRKQYKKILIGQSRLISSCMYFLKKWKVKEIQSFQQNEMRQIQKIKPYLLSLEEAISL